MDAPLPDYNRKNPDTLIAAGLIKGEPVGVKVGSIKAATLDGRIRIASLSVRSAVQDMRGGEHGVIAIKAVEDAGLRPPRNVRREAQLMSETDHPNVREAARRASSGLVFIFMAARQIIGLYNAYLLPTDTPLQRFALFMPWYPATLSSLLRLRSMSPEASPNGHHLLIANSLSRQLVSAVAHLHERQISHRDINPNNIVVSASGRLVLIDFGIAIRNGDEKPGEMHFQVGTQ